MTGNVLQFRRPAPAGITPNDAAWRHAQRLAIWRDGIAARAAGRPASACPHSAGSHDAVLWLRGWEKAPSRAQPESAGTPPDRAAFDYTPGPAERRMRLQLIAATHLLPAEIRARWHAELASALDEAWRAGYQARSQDTGRDPDGAA